MSDIFCLRCGTPIADWDSAYYARSMFCIPCYQSKQREAASLPCAKCGVRTSKDELEDFRGKSLCTYCLREAKQEVANKECAFCKKWIEDWEEKFRLPDGKPVCKACHDSQKGRFALRACSKCGKGTPVTYFSPDGKMLCQPCAISAKNQAAQPLFIRAVGKIGQYLSARG